MACDGVAAGSNCTNCSSASSVARCCCASSHRMRYSAVDSVTSPTVISSASAEEAASVADVIAAQCGVNSMVAGGSISGSASMPASVASGSSVSSSSMTSMSGTPGTTACVV